MRARVFAGWKDALCGAGQSRCGGGGECGRGAVFGKGYFDTRLPGQSYFGAEPEALAVNADGSRLYVANCDERCGCGDRHEEADCEGGEAGQVEPIGFVPTEWMPMSMAFIPAARAETVCRDRQRAREPGRTTFRSARRTRPSGEQFQTLDTYIGTLLYGSLATLDAAEIERNLPQWTAVVLSRIG